MDTQGGKKLRALTKHQDLDIKATAAEVLNVWKMTVAAEAKAVEKTKEQLGELMGPARSLSHRLLFLCLSPAAVALVHPKDTPVFPLTPRPCPHIVQRWVDVLHHRDGLEASCMIVHAGW